MTGPDAQDTRTFSTPSAWTLSATNWKDAFVGSYGETGDDNLGIVAAGVGFYAFLSLVPLLAAIVLIYGLAVDIDTVAQHVSAMANVLPDSATELIRTELDSVVSDTGSSKGFGLILALGFALYAARNAAAAVIVALNIAYDVKDDRSFIARTLLALAITLAGIVGAGIALGATTAATALGALVPGLPEGSRVFFTIVSYVILYFAGMAAAATLYRYGPNRAEPHWRWISPGSLFAATGWLIVTIGFGIYVGNFGSYDATYGSLGAVIVLMTWMWLSAYVLLFGAELNSAVKNQIKAGQQPAPAQ